MALTQLKKDDRKNLLCPKCGDALKRLEGGPVAIVNGKVDMSATLPKFACGKCGVYYQELLNSGYFDEYPWQDAASATPAAPKKPKRVIRTGDIAPTQLKREADGKCACPRCGERMDFVEGQPVRIVDGKPDMENVKDHFNCPYCRSVYRRIATTDYFQWSEK